MEGKQDDEEREEESMNEKRRLKVNGNADINKSLNWCELKFNFLIFTVNKTRKTELIKLKSHLDSIWATSVCVFFVQTAICTMIC